MSYATIMVQVDVGRHSASRIKFASHLADRFHARLIGVAACQPTLPIVLESTFMDSELMADAEGRASAVIEQAADHFRATLRGLNNTEWRSALTQPTEFLIEQARAADLIVVGREGADDQKDWQLGISAGDLLMGAGRPVLIVPPAQTVPSSRIVVGWANTREARRATWDALPLLRAAEEVLVVSVEDAGDDGSAKDVASWLGRHGATARVELVSSAQGSTTDEILRQADRFGADLIVAGAYGHSRTREWVLGGVTRQLLETTPLCCLMSH